MSEDRQREDAPANTGQNSDENDGFDRLLNTHRRIRERLETLVRAASELSDGARRFQAVEDVAGVARFLARAAKRHHEDEELSLFPRVAGVASLAPIVAQLRAEHVAHDAAADELIGMVRAWDPDEGPSAAEEARLPALAAELASAYFAHIDLEERELFPAARAALGPAVARTMAAEMVARRA